MSLLRHSSSFNSSRNCELQQKDRKPRKIFTIDGGFHSKIGVDRLHIPTTEGGRVLISIKDCIELTVRGPKVYLHSVDERMMQVTSDDKIDGLEATRSWDTWRQRNML